MGLPLPKVVAYLMRPYSEGASPKVQNCWNEAVWPHRGTLCTGLALTLPKLQGGLVFGLRALGPQGASSEVLVAPNPQR